MKSEITGSYMDIPCKFPERLAVGSCDFGVRVVAWTQGDDGRTHALCWLLPTGNNRRFAPATVGNRN